MNTKSSILSHIYFDYEYNYIFLWFYVLYIYIYIYKQHIMVSITQILMWVLRILRNLYKRPNTVLKLMH